MDFSLKNFSKNYKIWKNEIKKIEDEILKLFDEKNSKGSKCSVEGTKYEECVYKVVKNLKIENKKFNNQEIKELGGSSSKNDILCKFKEKEIPIEIKKSKTPDWMQCAIYYDLIENIWKPVTNSKIPKKCSEIFSNLIKEKEIFGNKTPIFLNKKITYEEWKSYKKENNEYNDIYFEIPDDTIRNLYKLKGCYYIQISDYGLYHLGDDICDFKVPEFKIEQRLRIRIKIHETKDSKGNCKLSVMASCLPKNIKKIKKSIYSLDNLEKIPIIFETL